MDVLHPEGLFKEPITGMIYPESVGDFHRVNVVKYAPDGSDESVGYNLETPNSEIAMTVYFFRSPPLTSLGSPQSVIDEARAHLCAQQFGGIESEVTTAHTDARLLGEDTASLAQLGTTFVGHKATYELTLPNFFGRRQTTHSEAYLFCYAGSEWTVEYRVDYPADSDSAAAIAAFMRDFRWTINPTWAMWPYPGCPANIGYV